MHSSRMRTARLLAVSPSMHCTREVYLVWGVYLLGGCTWSRGVYLPGGVPGPGGVPAQRHVPGLGGVPGPRECTCPRGSGGVPGG